MEQMAFPIPFSPDLRREDFLIAASNVEAVRWIEELERSRFHALFIYGDSGCGKTHLAHIFSDELVPASEIAQTDFSSFGKKIVIEDVDENTNEEALFHLYNFAQETGRFLLLTGTHIPQFSLPDLSSRMQATMHVKINPPDDDMLCYLLVKGFNDRHILVAPEVIEYVIKNIERSYQAVQSFLERADRLSLEMKRGITIPVVKLILEEEKA